MNHMNVVRKSHDLSMVQQSPLAGGFFPQNTPILQRDTVSEKIIEQESSSEEEINLDYIITKKPSTKIVRDFMRANLDVIESEEQKIFG
jgi:hypothetical protein